MAVLSQAEMRLWWLGPFAVVVPACADLIGADFDRGRARAAGGTGAPDESTSGGNSGRAESGRAGATAPSSGDLPPAGQAPPGEGGVGGRTGEGTTAGAASELSGGSEQAGSPEALAGAPQAELEAGAPSFAGVGTGGSSSAGAANGGTGGTLSPSHPIACGVPTRELDLDGDGLNARCDPDDDDDGVLDGADANPKSPSIPTQLPASTSPGVVLNDACVRTALDASESALRAAGWSAEFPVARGHGLVDGPRYYLRPAAAGRDDWGQILGGTEDRAGEPVKWAELKLVPVGDDLVDFFEVEFLEADAGEWPAAGAARSASKVTIRGSSSAFTVYLKVGTQVSLISGKLVVGGAEDVLELSVDVGTEYPNANCSTESLRWSLAWSPLWLTLAPADLPSICIDGEDVRLPKENWTRAESNESCSCQESANPEEFEVRCKTPLWN